MGNRAVVAINGNTSPNSKCLYFHWNGGRASIEGFMRACAELGVSGTPDQQLAQVEFYLRPWFGSSTLYLETFGTADKDNFDNGLYIVAPYTLGIMRREFVRYGEEVNREKTQSIYEDVIAHNTIHCRYEGLTGLFEGS